ncbi:hypothetical protein V2J09_001343 [Rumex salicifolius]
MAALMRRRDSTSQIADSPEVSASALNLSSSAMPMEKMKKRKAYDKERRLALKSSKDEENSKKQKTSEVVMGDQSSNPLETTLPITTGISLPKFHITVFSSLSSIDSSKREAAAEMLVSELVEVQRAYDEISDKQEVKSGSMLEAEKDDGLDDCETSVRYAVRRLVRGVASSRECARQGFALGLAALVAKVPKIRVGSVLKLIDDACPASTSLRGQEAKDYLLGRLFALAALARSGRLGEELNSNHETSYVKEVTRLLVSLASRKRYLQEPAVSALLSLADMLPTEVVVNHILVAPGLREWFESAQEAGNPDALLLALKLQEKISNDSKIFGKLLPHPFSSHGLFATDHLSSIANCLKESTFCQPRVHSIWPVLVNMLLPDAALLDETAASSLTSAKKHKKNRRPSSTDEDVATNLVNFCEVIIEETLLVSSHDRKHLAFDLLLLMLPKLPASCVPIVLSQKFVRCLMDVLITKDSWLHKVSEHFLKGLVDWVRHSDIRRVHVIVALQKHSKGKFDCITKTKTVRELMASFTTESGCMLFIQKLTTMFVDEDHVSDEPSVQSQTTGENSEIGLVDEKESTGMSGGSDLLKSWIIESLPSILKHLHLDPEAKFRVEQEVMKFLAVQGLFSASLGTEVTSFELGEKFRWPRTSISDALSRNCCSLVLKKKGRFLRQISLRKMISALSSCAFLAHYVIFLQSLDTEDDGAFKKLQVLESRLSREERNAESNTNTMKVHALRYLLIQLVLQLLLRPGELAGAAFELIICISKNFAFNELIESSGEDDSENSPDPLDVQLDTLLSLLPQSSAPLRYAIEQVFKGMCSDISDDGLLRMLRIIKKDLKPARHRTEESEDDDDDDDEDDILNFEEDEDSDVAEMDTDGGLATLGSAGDNDITENSDGSDGSDEDMDDEAMFRMDSYLAKIFQEKKNQVGGDNTTSQLNLFKLRVLSLLEIYLHENPDASHVLLIYSNLVQVFINPNTMETSEQLGQRIWGILQKIFKSKRYPKSDIQLATLVSLLQKNIRLASKPFKKKKAIAILSKKKRSSALNRYKMIVSLAQNSTHWILKIVDACKLSESEHDKVLEVFQNAVVAYFDSKKSQIKPEFLSEVFKRRPWVGHRLFGFLLKRCREAKSGYRRVDSLDLLFGTLKSLLSDSADSSSKKILKTHLAQISDVVQILVKNMPEKQAKRAAVRKFCNKILQIVSTHEIAKAFLKTLDEESQNACEVQLGETFLSLKKT